MARRLRIQYPNAIYHVMARGNGRQDIVADDGDRGRLLVCLERAVNRSGWVLYAFVVLTNHLHLVLKTPRPNLAKGMQLFLSSYANGWARRHQHSGHLFQGRYRTELVEDETYPWVLTRYVHLNPVRAGLAAKPDAWRWSSCPGYFRRRDLVPILGLSRPESVPNLSARFATLLATDTHAKNELLALEVLLGLRGLNSKSV